MNISYEVRKDPDSSDWNERSVLVRIKNGVETEIAYDGGEPEDNYFHRDLGVYVMELNRLAKIISEL